MYFPWFSHFLAQLLFFCCVDSGLIVFNGCVLYIQAGARFRWRHRTALHGEQESSLDQGSAAVSGRRILCTVGIYASSRGMLRSDVLNVSFFIWTREKLGRPP